MLKQFEDLNAFNKHEILLEILFTSSLVIIEDEIIDLRKKRAKPMSYFYNLSRSIYNFSDEDESSELNSVNESVEQIKDYIIFDQARCELIYNK